MLPIPILVFLWVARVTSAELAPTQPYRPERHGLPKMIDLTPLGKQSTPSIEIIPLLLFTPPTSRPNRTPLTRLEVESSSVVLRRPHPLEKCSIHYELSLSLVRLLVHPGPIGNIPLTFPTLNGPHLILSRLSILFSAPITTEFGRVPNEAPIIPAETNLLEGVLRPLEVLGSLRTLLIYEIRMFNTTKHTTDPPTTYHPPGRRTPSPLSATLLVRTSRGPLHVENIPAAVSKHELKVV